MRILFIKLRHIGDSLLLTPTIAATKKKYPHAEIWVLVRETCDGILTGCPEIDRILTTANPDTAKRTNLGWLSDLKLAALLRCTHFDFVFELTDNDRARFLALLSGLEAATPGQLRAALRRIDDIIAGAPFKASRFTKFGTGLTAEQIYVNQKITDLVSKAEMEQSDYRENRHLNVFFGPTKEYLGIKVGILWFNTSVLILSTLTLFVALGLILRSQIRMRLS